MILYPLEVPIKVVVVAEVTLVAVDEKRPFELVELTKWVDTAKV